MATRRLLGWQVQRRTRFGELEPVSRIYTVEAGARECMSLLREIYPDSALCLVKLTRPAPAPPPQQSELF